MLYQSTGSNTCAISALGNLLSLYGVAVTHNESRELFESTISKKWTVVTHSILLEVVRRCISRNLEWRKRPNFSFDLLWHDLASVVGSGPPALFTFHMRHARKAWTGVHCVVVVAVDEAGIHVIDSLGRRDGRWPNATITPQRSVLGWSVKGAPLIVTRGPVRTLIGLPPIRKFR